MQAYLELTEYNSSIIMPDQLPAEDWPNILVIDARDAAQLESDHIHGAVNIEWRQADARRDEIPRDTTVVIDCNTGSLSAQAVFALHLLGLDNVRGLAGRTRGLQDQGRLRGQPTGQAVSCHP